MKKILTLFLAFAILLSTPLTPKAAAGISTGKVVLKVGQTKTIRVSGAKKKVSFRTSGSAVKIVRKAQKACRVKAVKTGKSVLTASVDGKKLKCSITVKETELPMNKNIDIRYETLSDTQLLAYITNNNKMDVNFSCKFILYKDGNAVGDDLYYNYCLGAGATTAVIVKSLPEKAFDSAKATSLNTKKSHYKHFANAYTMEYRQSDDLTECTFTINCLKSVDTSEGCIVMYDADDNPIMTKTLNVLNLDRNAGDISVVTKSYPDEYKTIGFDHCRLYLDHAYLYNY